MPVRSEGALLSHQAVFHQRWQHLNDPHVRALAWLLDAPGLLDPAAPEWQGRIATLGPADAVTAQWLHDLDREPSSLHAALAQTNHTRLGRYAEDLLAFYLHAHKLLFAHGLQVRTEAGTTLGEFDFLLPESDGEGEGSNGLRHWEFATKLYLLEAHASTPRANDYVGPNLADTLGLKLDKIMRRQLTLGSHPAAAKVLPQPVRRAQALLKGWLFYRAFPSGVTAGLNELHLPTSSQIGCPIAVPHCRGFWMPLNARFFQEQERFVMLPRLAWLAPAKVTSEESEKVLHGWQLLAALETELGRPDAAPVLIARMEQRGEDWLESERGFVVPADWETRPRNWVKRATPA